MRGCAHVLSVRTSESVSREERTWDYCESLRQFSTIMFHVPSKECHVYTKAQMNKHLYNA